MTYWTTERFISTAEIPVGIERYDNETSKSESNQKVNDKVQLSADTGSLTYWTTERFISTAEIPVGIERYDNETSKSESNQKVNDKVQLSADTARSIRSQD